MVALDHVWSRPGYVRWKVRRIIRRSGAITVRNLSNAAGRCMRAGAFVTSDGIGGAVPLRDWRSRVVVVLGWGVVGVGMAFPSRVGVGAKVVIGHRSVSGRLGRADGGGGGGR